MDITIVLGSKSDMPVAEKATKILDTFDVRYQIRIASAHRSPDYLHGIVEKAEQEGCMVYIGMAGVAAALPGVLASMTSKPVIGVPVGSKVPYDSLLSIVQMPPGMPVATVGVDRGDNAALLALQIIGIGYPGIAAAVVAYRESRKNAVIADDQALQQERGE
ncbi:MAG: 5-(carboxyamino)imidazole ribonucleotide mutase [Candidatus Thalassarchaeaceae archaeon]|nr:5-(carboxyamino)imidazole ribonucleotide mutase [Candidatus Thalassarchaeaceae archaeon]|tara:strand:- start:830 stop:1315 length:486 start_codon:yes stop_codon:yes gene_type:complete